MNGLHKERDRRLPEDTPDRLPSLIEAWGGGDGYSAPPQRYPG